MRTTRLILLSVASALAAAGQGLAQTEAERQKAEAERNWGRIIPLLDRARSASEEAVKERVGQLDRYLNDSGALGRKRLAAAIDDTLRDALKDLSNIEKTLLDEAQAITGRRNDLPPLPPLSRAAEAMVADILTVQKAVGDAGRIRALVVNGDPRWVGVYRQMLVYAEGHPEEAARAASRDVLATLRKGTNLGVGLTLLDQCRRRDTERARLLHASVFGPDAGEPASAYRADPDGQPIPPTSQILRQAKDIKRVVGEIQRRKRVVGLPPAF